MLNLECELCKAASEDYRLIFKDQYCFCIVNIRPIKEGHLLVLPIRHVESLNDLSSNELKSIHSLLDKLEEILRNEYNQSSLIALNRGDLAQDKHLHYHILPSKKSLRNLMTKSTLIREKEQVLRKMADDIKTNVPI